ncbi:hypothetical protein JRO89_XS07G0235900 [Xanthoceras sorbifolium]|uniref:Uncharacterized protein n=1 Tax=Xanthoceras sorbifolium TaxID=99658 RepID=A0ABQ8HUW9_9ROSI|nr:hypothetical protein JRO89_XS07G0235900 [Xanthoceras sorbifolium]
MPNFQKDLVIECDASGLSAYENEMLAALIARTKMDVLFDRKTLQIDMTMRLSIAVAMRTRHQMPCLRCMKRRKHQPLWTYPFLKLIGSTYFKKNRRKTRKFRDQFELKANILQEARGGVKGGHSRIRTTLERNKTKNVASPGFLQPLLVRELVWSDISIDFIEDLPKSHVMEVIMMVVDRLSKYSHFLALSHLFTANDVA